METKTKIITGASGVGLTGLFLTMMLLGVFNSSCVGSECLIVETTCNGTYFNTYQNFTGYETIFYNTSYLSNETGTIVTIEHNYTQPVYETINEPYCPKDKIESMTLTYKESTKTIEFHPTEYTYSFKDGVLTVKDIGRGASWNDPDLDNCVNPGIPCEQISFNPMPEQTIKEFSDKDMSVQI